MDPYEKVAQDYSLGYDSKRDGKKIERKKKEKKKRKRKEKGGKEKEIEKRRGKL